MADRAVAILRGLRFGLSVVVALAVMTGVANATTVTSTADSGAGSLRDAIASTPSGGTVSFAPGLSGTITLTGGVLSITQSINISGPGAGRITIDAHHASTVFDIAPSAANQDVTISGLTIANGSATTDGGGILANDLVRTLTLTGDTITGNQVSITNPAGSSGGGGVYINGGTLVVTNSAITGNSVALAGSSSLGGGGGGIFSNGGSVTITATTVQGNTVSISSSNGAAGGGGIYSNGGGVGLGASHIDGNSVTIAGGSAATSGGGGVYENGGAVSVGVSSIDGNTANITSTGGFNGGAGLFSNGGGISVIDSSISSNSDTVNSGGDSNGGGAVFDDSGQGGVYLTSTLSTNTTTLTNAATDNGGGAIRSADSILAQNMTIAGNRINAAGGGIFNNGSLQLKNTIIADNGADNCAGSGPFTSAGFNLESANTCGLNATGDLVNTEPRLGPVQNNGGPTPTQALLAGSPAIDAGSCTDLAGQPLSADQRGVARPQPAGGKCDIGAYELAPGAPLAVPGTPVATTTTAASFSASVNPQGQVTTVFFQYGIDSRFRPGGGTAVIYDQSTPAQTLPGDTATHAVSASATGLVPNALYHVRLVAQNALGTTFGPDQTFTTPADPAPPPPLIGHIVNAKPVSGQVFILVGTKLVPLTETKQIPSGAILDTRAGSLQITAAAGKHKRETGIFGGAIFKLTQAKTGLTNLTLAEGAFKGAPSYATCKAHKAAEASAAASKTLQLLHASAHGKFKTTGRYSAATVRGTKWTISDRCDGTLTHDITDSIAVSDFVRHKTIVLHAGQSYLARAHKPKK